jgi:solute:Na+ symporter, SSS family
VSQGLVWLLAFLAAYVAYCLYWGVVVSRSSAGAGNFLIAGRNTAPAVFVLVATGASLSGWIALGHPAMVFQAGLPFAELAIAAVVIPLTGVLFLKRQWILGARFGYVTQGDMLADYFSGEAVRVLSVLVALVFAVPFLGMQLAAIGRLLDVLSDGVVDAHAAAWALGLVVFLYAALGGFRAVTFVGALQALLALTGMVVLGGLAYARVGGFDALVAAMARFAATPEAAASGLFAIPGVIGFSAGIEGAAPPGGLWTTAMILSTCLALAGVQASPAFTILGFSCRDVRGLAAQQVWTFGGVVGVILLFFAVAQGLGPHFFGAPQSAAAGYSDLTAPYLQPLAQTDPWLMALLAACALAAVQVAAALFASAGATALTIDIYKRFVRPAADGAELKLTARIALACLFLLALLLATFAPRATAAAGTLAPAFAVQLVPALAGVCWYRWITREGATLGIIAGLVAVLLTEPAGALLTGLFRLELPWGRWPWTIHSAAWGLFCNLLVCAVVSAATYGGAARQHRAAFHDLLDAHAPLTPRKRVMKPAAWALTLAWAFFAVGPGAIIGNDLFGAPEAGPAGWGLNVPSLWAWQIVWWALGMLMIWWLAYKMELSTAPALPVRFEADRSAGGAAARPPLWIRNFLRRVT